jgi:hypothetical protein
MSSVVLLNLVVLNSGWVIRVPLLIGTPMDLMDQTPTMMKKEQTWKMLSERIAQAGITVSRNAKSVGAKTSRTEGEYKKAFDFVNNTGQGLMENGQDITDINKKMCPYFYELDPIMGSKVSTCTLDFFESEGNATELGDAAKLEDLLEVQQHEYF